MSNLSTPSKKKLLNLLNYYNEFLIKNLNQLKFDNIKKFFEILFFDRRFIITFFIIIASIFAHLSAPAFYQDKWVISKIKKQLENEFNITFILPDKVNYSMFPVPSFNLKNIELVFKNHKLGKIDLMRINLAYNKFFDKEKVNIQNVHIKNSKFEIYDSEIKNLFSFLDTEINNRKLYITNSQLFLKNKNDNVYAILTLKKSTSFFDNEKIKNFLNFEGEIFNTSINATITNDYLSKKTNLDFKLKDINKEFNLNINYLKNTKEAKFEIIDRSDSYSTNIKFNNKSLHFKSDERNESKFSYNGIINYKPFNSNINIKSKVYDLKNLLKQNGILLQTINSNLFNNSNLNYKIDFRSKKIRNHRLLSDFVLCLIFDQKNFNFNGTELKFDNNVNIKIVESIYKSYDEGNVFSGKIIFLIEDEKKLYKFFQTRKMNRKPLNKISFVFDYNFDNSELSVKEIQVDDKSNNKIKNIQKKYEKKKIKSIKKFEIKKIFNEIAAIL